MSDSQKKSASHEDEYSSSIPPIPDSEFCVFGVVYCDPPHAPALAEIYAQLTAEAATEPGTIYYAICRDDADQSKFHFFERYASRAAFEAHVARPLSQKIINSGWFLDVKAKFVTAIAPEQGSVQ